MIAVPQMRCTLAWEKRFVTEPSPQLCCALAREQRFIVDPGPQMRCALAREKRSVTDRSPQMRCALAREQRFIRDPGPQMRCALAREQRFITGPGPQMRCALAREQRFHRSWPGSSALGARFVISLCAAPWPGRSALFTNRVRILLPEAPRGALAGQRMQIYRSLWAPGNPDCDICAAPWPGRSALSFQDSGCLFAAHLGCTGGSQHEMRMLGKAAEIAACMHKELPEPFHKLEILQQCKIRHDSDNNV